MMEIGGRWLNNIRFADAGPLGVLCHSTVLASKISPGSWIKKEAHRSIGNTIDTTQNRKILEDLRNQKIRERWRKKLRGLFRVIVLCLSSLMFPFS